MSIKIKAPAGPAKDAIYNEWLSKNHTFPGGTQLLSETERIGKRIEKEMANSSRKGPVIGAVVGSVQSGKTASMVGLAGHLFKQGFQVVTVLAGLKDDLRYQTATRFCTDLFSYGTPVFDYELNANGKPLKRKPKIKTPKSYTHPDGNGPHGSLFPNRDFFVPEPIIMDIDTTTSASIFNWIRIGVPVVLFVKKIARKSGGGGPMGVLKTAIQQVNDDLVAQDLGKLKHAIIDDESDEASVGATIKSVAPEKIKQIVDIGDAAYVGFTATPQANIFSVENNPLRPKHFIELLKYPAAYGIGLPNVDVCYDNGENYVQYTGGFVFHEWNEMRKEPNFFREAIDKEYKDKDIHSALISYIVSGAIKLVQKNATFPNAAQTKKGVVPSTFTLPNPHSMLIHAHVKTADHFGMAGNIACSVEKVWPKSGKKSAAKLYDTKDTADVGKAWGVSKTILINSLKTPTRLKKFEEWYDKFSTSTISVRKHSPGTPGIPSWKEVKAELEQVIKNINIRVVNHVGEENLFYDSSKLINGDLSIPDDIYSIIVAGNKMGRGITVKGLCTTVFLRTAKKPSADVTIQRQRWFGYRGKELGLIRIFTDDDIWNLLDGVNADDEGMKREIALRRDLRPDRQEWNTFFTSAAAKLSGKIKSNSRIFFSYSHYDRGWFPYFNNPASKGGKKVNAHNWNRFDYLMDDWVSKGMQVFPTSSHYLMGQTFDSTTSKNTGKKYGQRLDLIEVAEILESFQIHGHNPDSKKGQLGNLKALKIPRGYMPKPGSSHAGKRHPCFNKIDDDPYHIALFLRHWAKDKGRASAMFNVVIRNGSGKRSYTTKKGYKVALKSKPFLKHWDSLYPNNGPIRHALTWGSMGDGQRGDGRSDDSRTWPKTMTAVAAGAKHPRKKGEPGLLIFEIGEDAHGNHCLRTGLVTPQGGPAGTTIKIS